jgi:kinesin family protein C1
VARLQEELFAGEGARRALHNQVQELKGNIRVFVRVRPFLPGDAVSAVDGAAGEGFAVPALADGSAADGPAFTSVSCPPDGTSIAIIPPPPRGTKEGHRVRDAGKPSTFAFDTVFSQRAGQADVFAEVCHLVQSALDGYQVCLFSYGQTGSGACGRGDSDSSGSGGLAALFPCSRLWGGIGCCRN